MDLLSLFLRSPRSEDDLPVLMNGGAMLTHAELSRKIFSCSSVLMELGAGTGSRLAVMLDNCHEYIVLLYAAVNIGAAFVPLQRDRLDAAKAILTSNAFDFLAYDAADAAVSSFIESLDMPGCQKLPIKRDPPGAIPFNRLCAESPGTEAAQAHSEDIPAIVLYPESDRPFIVSQRMILHELNQVGFEFAAQYEAYVEGRITRTGAAMSLSSFNAILQALFALSNNRIFCVFTDEELQTPIQSIVKYRVNALYASAQMLLRIAVDPLLATADLEALHHIWFFAPSTPLELKLLLQKNFPPHISIANNYGVFSPWVYESDTRDGESTGMVVEDPRYDYSYRVPSSNTAIVNERSEILPDGQVGYIVTHPGRSGSKIPVRHWTATHLYGYKSPEGNLCILGYELPNGTNIGKEYPHRVSGLQVSSSNSIQAADIGTAAFKNAGAQATYLEILTRFHQFLDTKKLIDYYLSVANVLVDATVYGIHVFDMEDADRYSIGKREGEALSEPLSGTDENRIVYNPSLKVFAPSHNTICIPLLSSANQMIGAISFGRTSMRWVFTKEEQEALKSISLQLSVALENAIEHSSLVKKSCIMDGLLQSVSFPLMAVDLSGEVVYSNKAWQKLLSSSQRPGAAQLAGVANACIHKVIAQFEAGNADAGSVQEVYAASETLSLGSSPCRVQAALVSSERIVTVMIILETELDFSYLSFILSDRQIEIVKLIADGLSNHEIAEKLFVSAETVKTHIKTIFNKLDVGSRAQLLMKVCSYISSCNLMSLE